MKLVMECAQANMIVCSGYDVNSETQSAAQGCKQGTCASACAVRYFGARQITDSDDPTCQVPTRTLSAHPHPTHHEHLRTGAEAAQLPQP